MMLKRALAVFLTVLLMVGTGGGASAVEEGPSVDSIAWYIITSGCSRDITALERVDQTRDSETVAYYLTQVYGLEPDSWTDCAIYRAGGTEAFEIAVIRMAEGEVAAKAAADTLKKYIETREGDFAGYEPEQADIVHQSRAISSPAGDAALFICPDPATAVKAFAASYDALVRTPFDPPGTDDMTLYDTSAILAAWESGETSGLSEKDAAILEKASDVLAEVTTEDMTVYEREKAVYAWITAHVIYDQDHYDKLAELDPDSSTPYGPLYNGKAICVGFAVTFQLFMDMLDVECITVVGASRQNVADHAWNMVRLDGNWYCVDSTWDVGDDEESWQYFNVTSDAMVVSNHQWDYEAVPEATATDGGAGAQ